jgi:hypothetical protein
LALVFWQSECCCNKKTTISDTVNVHATINLICYGTLKLSSI